MSYMSNMASNGKRKASERDEISSDDSVRINFSIRAQDGSRVFFKVNPDRYLKIPFKKYCQKSNLEYETVTFLLEGKRINGNRQTPRTLKLKNGAEIDVMKQQTGGGDEAL
ncbi:small ubiquitin-related modifier 2 isoform X2 [Medicago truncatula]|uniref:small ubiquitin-related modifier 2 isoform X2 n=1 Tax=Medicago truncatula TaxID=3880 RepID=UPI0000D5F315|nr:small ubiquitin-related modifier 2 isoform X2 [Medicago truncatula]